MRVLFFLMACFVLNTLSAQIWKKIELKKDVDPSIPTNLFTRYDSEFDIQIDEDTYVVGNIWSFGYAFNDRNFVSGSTSLAYYERSEAFGIGDVELAYTHLVKSDTLALVTATGFKVNTILPTGNYDKYIGLGSVRVTPSFFATLKLHKKIYVLPEGGYLYTTKTLQETNNQPKNIERHGYFLSTKFIYKLGLNNYLWVTPIVGSESFNAKSNVSLEMVYGAKILKRFGLTVIVKPNFTTQTMEYKVGNSIFFNFRVIPFRDRSA